MEHDTTLSKSVAARASLALSLFFLLVYGATNYLTSMRGDVMQAMRVIPDSLRAHDVRYVSGRLIRSGDAFPDAWHGFGWGWDDFDFGYSAGVDELYFAVPGVIKDPDRLKGLYELFAETLDRLCAIGSAYERDPHVTL